MSIPNQHQRGTQTTRGAIASGFKSALSCVVGVPTSYDLQHDTRLRAGGFFLVKLAGRHCPVPFSYRTRSFLSLTSGRRNRMAGCAKRQSRAGIRRIYTSGQFSLSTGMGRGSANCRLPANFHRRVCSSLSRRYWHGVELRSLGSAVPFLIRGAFHRSRFNSHSVDYVPAKFANRPHHSNRVLSSWKLHRWVQPSDGVTHGAGKRRHVLGQISQGSRDV